MTACRLTVIGRTHSHRPIQRVRREIQVGHIRITDGHDVERRTTAIEDSKPAAASDLVDDVPQVRTEVLSAASGCPPAVGSRTTTDGQHHQRIELQGVKVILIRPQASSSTAVPGGPASLSEKTQVE